MMSTGDLIEKQEHTDAKRQLAVTSFLFELDFHPVLRFIIGHFFKTVHCKVQALRKCTKYFVNTDLKK